MSELDRRSFMKACAAAGALGLEGWQGSLAKGEQLSIARYKTSPSEDEAIAEEAVRLTEKAIAGLGGMSRFVSRGQVVWIKPNIGWERRAAQAATTNPDLVATLVRLCFEAGAKSVFVADNTCNTAQRTYSRSGIQQAAEKAGARVVFLDQRKFRRMALKGRVLKEWEVYTDMVEADLLINVPIVKQHNLCAATLGMKNLMGVVGGQRNRYHQDIGNTVADLAAFLKPRLVVLDGIRVLASNGPVGGNLADVKRKDVVAAGIDQVAVDAFGASLLGLRPEQVAYIAEAARRGLGTANYAALGPREQSI
ncbi:MAG: DUF362 domain-containing protein [Acidobacteriota bacterium]